MKKIFISFLIIFCSSPCVFSAGAHKYYEKEYQNVWCSENNGILEVILPDKARVDCVTSTHAIEFDFAQKWSESIGQALYYAAVLNKKAGVVLIMENGEKDIKYLERLKKVAELYNITVWTMNSADLEFALKKDFRMGLK